MKKCIAITALVIAMLTLLTACGKFTCDECEQESKGEKYTISWFGEEKTVCDECHQKFKIQTNA